MAASNLPPPQPFLENPGEPRFPFLQWLKSFDNYVLAIEGSNFADDRKRALLIHCLGSEGQRLYYALPSHLSTFEATRTALTTFFAPKQNVVAERYKFRSRSQMPGETVDHFVAALREQATKCNFREFESEMIRDQLVEKTSATRVRERLLLEDDLTLDKAISLARHIESAMKESKILTEDSTQISALTTKKTYGKSNRFSRSRSDQGTKTKTFEHSKLGLQCYRCGSPKHIASSSTCPAKEVKCHLCGKNGHFGKVCKSTPLQKQGTVNELETSGMTILQLDTQGTSDRKIWCDATVSAGTQSVQIPFMVDTGSTVSLLPYGIVSSHLGKAPIKDSHLHLITYSGEPLNVLGRLNASITVRDTIKETQFHVVQEGAPILGMDVLSTLGMRIEGDKLIFPELANVTIASVTSEKPQLGYAKGFCHKIRIKDDAVPVRQKLRRLPLTVRDAVSAELRELEAKGVIERINSSEWASPIVVTRKKDGNIRMCVDLREVNKNIVPDSHPLPVIDDILSELSGSTVFSKLDLKSAYHQLLLHQDSRDATAFITHDGLFRFCRVPYGLCSASSAFEKLMDCVLKGLQGVEHYQDDLIVHGKDHQEHDRRLELAIRRLHNSGLQLNMEKCELRRQDLDFLGVHLSKEGIHPTQNHIEAILNAPQPTSVTELRSFLGLAAWYNKFVPNFSDVVEPLRTLTRNGVPFDWTPIVQESFEKVKFLLSNGTILSPFDPTLPTTVTTDASDIGLGAVLTQRRSDNSIVTIAFASRTLSTTERKYSIVEKEALACVWATEKWRTWLWGRKFILETDHRALTTLLSTKGNDRASLRLARWSARLLSFDYEVRYIRGESNVVADCLSRLPLPCKPNENIPDPEVVATVQSILKAVNLPEFRNACEECPVLAQVRYYIEKGWPATSKALSPTLLPYYRVREELAVVDELIVKGLYKTLVPSSLCKTLVDIAHESHQGMTRTKQRLRGSYWWPQMDTQVTETVRNCPTCAIHDKTARLRTPPITPVPYPSHPWTKVAIDIVGPMQYAPNHLRYAVTMVDYYSKWPEVAFASTMDTDAVMTFMESVYAREGYPHEVVTDNGPQFISHQFADFLERRNIRHLRSSFYHPQANGEVERFNRVLKETIQTALINGSPWKPFLTKFLMDYRATPHASTQLSPSHLLHGRPLRTNLETVPPRNERTNTSVLERRVKTAQTKMKTYTDRRRAASHFQFTTGDYVRVRRPCKSKKAGKRFSPPKRIVRKVAPYTYELDDRSRFNATMLAPYNPPRCEPSTDEHEPVHDRVELRRSQRTHKPPTWMKDYM